MCCFIEIAVWLSGGKWIDEEQRVSVHGAETLNLVK